MKSPFPGMDPFLESHWRDVHTLLIASAQEALNEILPGDLIARNEERVYVENDAPVLLDIDSEPVTERYIEIVESDGRKVVTAIEFISPKNKIAGNGRDAYLQKRREFLASSTNLVEIDLVRSGNWMALSPPYRVPPELRTTYRVNVRRVSRPGKAEFYPIPLQEKLPQIRIPLRETDEDVILDLQAVLDHAYRAGRYGATDYGLACDPELEEADEKWADELLRGAGRR